MMSLLLPLLGHRLLAALSLMLCAPAYLPASQALVTKSVPKSLGHISSLKHVFDLKLHQDAGADGRDKEATAVGAGGAAQRAVRFSCPVTGLPMGGKGRFMAIRKSGHVFSERALKDVPSVVEELVGGKWAAEDLLPLNPPAEELEKMREALLVKREAARATKRDKKKDKATRCADAGSNGATAIAHVGSKRGAAVQAGAGDASALNGGEVARSGPVANGDAAKKFRATELKPVGADEKVWSSIFTSSRSNGGVKNDFLVRGSTRMKTG